MSLEECLAQLADPAARLSLRLLTDLSDLDGRQTDLFVGVWTTVDTSRRLRIVLDLTDLAEDNVDLNFETVFKLALRDQEPPVRAAAIRGLFEYDGQDLIPVLIDALRGDPDVDVRVEGAIGLGRFALAAEFDRLLEGDAAAVRQALTAAVEDPEEDETVRARAIEALGALSGEEIQNLIESVYEEASIDLKIGAVDAMGRSRDEHWLPIVLRELMNEAPEMRHAAAFAAGSIGDEEAVKPLADLAMYDPDGEVQLAAIQSLGEIGGPVARLALKNLRDEGDDALCQAVEEALSEMAFTDDPLAPFRD